MNAPNVMLGRGFFGSYKPRVAQSNLFPVDVSTGMPIVSNKKTMLEKKLTAAQKRTAKKALPSKDAYSIPDKSHAENALARAKQYASPKDQATIIRNVKKEFPGINVDMKPSKPTVKTGPTSSGQK